MEQLFDHAVSLSLTLADTAAAVGSDPVTQNAAEVVQEGSKSGGFFGPIAALFENTLKVRACGMLRAYVQACALLACAVRCVSLNHTASTCCIEHNMHQT